MDSTSLGRCDDARLVRINRRRQTTLNSDAANYMRGQQTWKAARSRTCSGVATRVKSVRLKLHERCEIEPTHEFPARQQHFDSNRVSLNLFRFGGLVNASVRRRMLVAGSLQIARCDCEWQIAWASSQSGPASPFRHQLGRQNYFWRLDLNRALTGPEDAQ